MNSLTLANTIQPRWYQIEAEQSIWDYYEAGNVGNPVIGLPTGTGKSLVIAMFCYRVLSRWPDQRILVLTDDKKLIQQNADELLQLWPEAPLGIYSAGLKKKENAMPIVFAGVGSLNRNPKVVGFRDIVIIDECHMISVNESTMYRKVIASLKDLNPYLRALGFSATLYRSKEGSIVGNGLFTDICYDITNELGFNKLLAENFLCALWSPATKTTIDLQGIKIVSRGNEFVYDEEDVSKRLEKIMYEAAQESVALAKSHNRKCWLAFVTGEKNAETLAAMLNYLGIKTTVVYSKLDNEECDKRIKDFREGKYECIVNMNMLVKGFNHKAIDFIVDMAPTLSTSRHVQKCGRGTRVFPGKAYTLYADFGSNTANNGPINAPVMPRKAGEKIGDMPLKTCPMCQVPNNTSAKVCWNSECKHEFQFEIKITGTSSNEPIISGDSPVTEYFEVLYVSYSKHEKRDSENKPTLKVSYICGLKTFSEWISVQGTGFALRKARDWWKMRTGFDIPNTVDECLSLKDKIKKPVAIKVWVNKGKFPEILGYEF